MSTALDEHRRLRMAKWSNAADAFFVQSVNPWIDIVAVSLLAASAWQIGVLNALSMMAFMGLGIPIGVFVDRHDRVRVLQISLAVKLGLAAALLAVTAAGQLGIGVLMVFVALMGVTTVASETAQISVVPTLTGDDRAMSSTVANIALWDRIASFAGPAAVAFGISRLNESVVLGVCLMFLMLGTLMALRLRGGAETVPAKVAIETDPPGGSRFFQDVADGWDVLVGDRHLSGMTWLSACTNAGLAIGSAVEAILVMQVLGLGIEFFGLLGSLGAVAGVLASTLAERISQQVSVKRLYIMGGLMQAVAAALPLVALSVPNIAVPLLVAHVVVWAGFLTVTNITAAIYAATSVDSGVLGRISAIRRTITMGVAPIASILGGVVGSLWGMWLPLALWPGLILVGVAIFWRLDRKG